jgi:hypothetical protein
MIHSPLGSLEQKPRLPRLLIKAGPISHDNTLSFKGLDIRSRPLTFQAATQGEHAFTNSANRTVINPTTYLFCLSETD